MNTFPVTSGNGWDLDVAATNKLFLANSQPEWRANRCKLVVNYILNATPSRE